MVACWVNFGLRLVLLPAFAAKAVLQLPYSYTREEPMHSGAWGAQASLAAASGGGQAPSGKAQDASAVGLPGTSQPLVTTLISKPEWQVVVRRIQDMYNALALLLYTAVPYNLLVSLVKLLGAGVFLTWLEPHLQRFLAIFIGKYQLARSGKDGQTEVLFSFANSVDTNFALPSGYAAFPFTDSALLAGSGGTIKTAARLAEAKRAHLCGMAAKLAYENPLTIADAVTRWGFTFLTDQKADHTSSTVPRTYWFAFYNANAVIVCFRGTSPLNLLNWQTDIDLGMSPHDGYGRVHDGFYEALFGTAQHKRSLRGDVSTSPDTVFDAAFEAITKDTIHPQAHVSQKSIYICGHSLGGALSSVFAMALAVEDQNITERIGGVLTYGQPRVGDDVYASTFQDTFGDKSLRHVHASDIVPRVPANLGYTHHGKLRYIPSFDISDTERVLSNDDQMSEWRDRETKLIVALGFSACKLLQSQWPPRESVLHTLTRCGLLFLPGLLDHFPGDYENLLRDDVAKKEKTPPAAPRPGKAPPATNGNVQPPPARD